MNESIAHIGCVCGQTFQVLNETGEEWDEVATAQAYNEHLQTHKG